MVIMVIFFITAIVLLATMLLKLWEIHDELVNIRNKAFSISSETTEDCEVSDG